jgi:hypothetical protein
MFRLRGCPRCKEDLREDKDKYGKYVTRLQCGYHESETKDSSSLSSPGQQERPSQKIGIQYTADVNLMPA